MVGHASCWLDCWGLLQMCLELEIDEFEFGMACSLEEADKRCFPGREKG